MCFFGRCTRPLAAQFLSVHARGGSLCLQPATQELARDPAPPMLQAKEKEATEKAEKLAEDADVDGSQMFAQQAEAFSRQHDALQKQFQLPERTMSVCEVCGVFINSTDNDQRRAVSVSVHLQGCPLASCACSPSKHACSCGAWCPGVLHLCHHAPCKLPHYLCRARSCMRPFAESLQAFTCCGTASLHRACWDGDRRCSCTLRF